MNLLFQMFDDISEVWKHRQSWSTNCTRHRQRRWANKLRLSKDGTWTGSFGGLGGWHEKNHNLWFWLSEESNEVTRSLGFLLFEIWISQIGWAVLKVRFLPLANLANLIIFGLGFHWLVAQPDSIRWLGAGFLCQGKYMTTFDNIWQTKRMPSTYDMNICSQDTVLPNMTCLCRTWDTYGCFLVVQYEKTCFSISNPQSPCHGTLT